MAEHGEVVIHTIATDLWRMHDRDFVAAHPSGPLRLDSAR
jgi:hypothetical protein